MNNLAIPACFEFQAALWFLSGCIYCGIISSDIAPPLRHGCWLPE
jgi:hypothetical protein